MNEQVILARLLARDETALGAIRERWGRPALALARRITGSAEDAEECLQDGLLAVWETVPPKRPEALGHYFTALVRNAALNRLRDERRQKRGGGTVPLALEELEYCASARDDVEEAVAARLLGERINDFLRALPRRERELFLRRYYDLEDLETLAAAKGLSKAHASVLLFRTRKKLKAFLEKEELL